MKYYYFLEGLSGVFERDDLVDFNVFPQYTLLTEEQLNYYLLHPNATRYEIEHHNDPLPELTLEEIKQNKIWEIESYDKSSAVNEFFLDDYSVWLDKTTRLSLSFSLTMEEAEGRTESTLWYGGRCFILSLEDFRGLLQQLEVYAKDCYNRTSQHKVNVEQLETREEVEHYDITVGYPEKLSFRTRPIR